VSSFTTLSTPHGGTPLARFFLSVWGQRMLQLQNLFTLSVLRFGRLPLSVAFRFGALLSRVDDRMGFRQTLLDQLFTQLLGDFSAGRQETLGRFFSEVGRDVSLIPELTSEGIGAFNTFTPDRPGVRYGSVVTQARPPIMRAPVGGARPVRPAHPHRLQPAARPHEPHAGGGPAPLTPSSTPRCSPRTVGCRAPPPATACHPHPLPSVRTAARYRRVYACQKSPGARAK
jgi:hypothetical protein